MGSPFHLISFPQRATLGIVLLCSFWASSLFGDKVTESVIVASIEGEVSSLNLIDDFKVKMSASYVGKKISSKTILTTGKTGKISLLFSNGTLITVKPGSRFYLRKYKQLEAVVEDLVPPGKLEEEPTKSELSAHLDFGELIVKAPKLKKGSSMNLSSPIGTAGIRGTMFQFMAVRNPVSGDIMGGINLVSGDIDFTDTDGNTVTILSGQSIQLATSKLGESVASQTGELVDLSSTYGPALTQEGALPPPISSIFPNLNLGGDSDEDGSVEEGSFDEPMVVGPSTGDLDFIHEIASEVFFAIESSEQVSSDFSFESIQFAPPVEAPIPEVEAPTAPVAITGDTVAGGNIDRFMGTSPDIELRGLSPGSSNNPLFEITGTEKRITAEFRSPLEFPPNTSYEDIWNNFLDPGVSALDFLSKDIEDIVSVSNVPNVLLPDPETAEQDAPPVGQSVVSTIIYQVTDFRNSTSAISREVELFATRPSFVNVPPFPERFEYYDPDQLFEQWINNINAVDVRNVSLTRGAPLAFGAGVPVGSYYLNPLPTVYEIGETKFSIITKDWRGLITESEIFQLNVTATPPTFDEVPVLLEQFEYYDPDQDFSAWVNGIRVVDVRGQPLVYGLEDGNGSFYLSPLPDVKLNRSQPTSFKIIARDWRGITNETSLMEFNVTATPPSFDEIPTLADRYAYKDQFGEFEKWINDINITDVRGQALVRGTPLQYDSSGSEAGYFLDPLPSVDNLGTTEFRIVARDWRGITSMSNLLTVDITALSPDFNITSENLYIELSDKPINSIDHNITAKDEFENPIALDESGNPISDSTITLISVTPSVDPGARIDSLEDQNYTLTYRVEDNRSIYTEVNRTLRVFVTSPVFSPVSFKSDADWIDANSTLEYKDPEDEIAGWIASQGASDLTGSDISSSITSSITTPGYEDLEESEYKDLPLGTYQIEFTATDPRLEEGKTNDDWHAKLKAHFRPVLIVVATPPKFTGKKFDSSASWLADKEEMEYLDTYGEIAGWIASQEASGPNSDFNISISSRITTDGYTNWVKSYSELPVGEYTIVFTATDDRYDSDETNPSFYDLNTEYNATLKVIATPPTFVGKPFKSIGGWLNGANATLEFHDPEDEIADWIASQEASGPNSDFNISISSKITTAGYTDWEESSYPELPVGEYTIMFTATDGRYKESNSYNPNYYELNTEYNASLKVIATAPSLEISSSDWRYDFDTNQTIKYLVKPRIAAYEDFPDADADDGPFTILHDGHSDLSNRSNPTIIVRATAFDDTDISDKIKVGGHDVTDISNGPSFGVDYGDDVDTAFDLNISIDDSSHRGIPLGGATQSKSISVKLFDTLGPFLRIPEGKETIMVKGSRDQEFPVPEIEIVDNYYSDSEIKSYLGISGVVNFYDDLSNFAYPDAVTQWFLTDPNLPLDLSDSEQGILGYSGIYPSFLTFNGITDLKSIPDRNEISFNVNVTDDEAPTIELISGNPYYVDLRLTSNFPDNILNGETGNVFEDPGVRVIENLFVHEPGESSIQLSSGRVMVDMIAEELSKSDERFSVRVQAYDKENNYTLLDQNLTQSIVEILEEYNSTTDSDKYLVTYTFTDRAGNSASVSRDFEFTNDPNVPSDITFEVLNVDDDNDLTNGIYLTEVDPTQSGESAFEPFVVAYYAISTGNVNVSVSKQPYFLKPSADINSTVDNLAIINRVNFYQNASGEQFYVGSDGNLTEKGTDSYPKNIVTYSAKNQFGTDYIYDLEIRIQDTTPPTFDLTQNTSLTLEGGQPYDDFNHSNLNDTYGSSSLIRKITKGTVNDPIYLGPDGSEPYDDFAEVGFWQLGGYTIRYTASDDFNNTSIKDRTITVEDTTPPHMALVSYEGAVRETTADQINENPTLDVRSDITTNATPLWTEGSTENFVRRSNPEDSTDNNFVLKYTEANSSLLSLGLNSSVSSINLDAANSEGKQTGDFTQGNAMFSVYRENDDYNRTHMWYSAFSLSHEGDVYFRDPGVYVYSTIDQPFTIDSNITNIVRSQKLDVNGNPTNDLISFSLNYSVTDSAGNINKIAPARQFTFVDEVAPTIYNTPTTSETLLLQLEAGELIADDQGSGYTLFDLNDSVSNPSSESRNLYAEDIRDGRIDEDEFTKIFYQLKDDGTWESISGTGYYSSSSDVNRSFRVDYTVSDSEGNEANASRYFIVKDTKAPSIDISTANTTVEINYDDDEASSEENAIAKILSDMNASDYKNIDNDLSTNSAYDKWTVTITKPSSDTDSNRAFIPGATYPYLQEGDGYVVEITVTDVNGNTSDKITRTLKVGDFKAPELTMIGDEVIHDFFRYGARPGIGNQDLFDDRDVTPEYNGTGLNSGAHRLMFADYSFVDPGIYAEDASFSLNEYPDFDGDGIGEAHAIIVQNPDENWPDPLTHGIIYCKSTFITTTLGAIQDKFADSSNTLFENNSSIRYDDNSTASSAITVRTINYRVKDGWGNVSDANRTIYIYESDWASATKAFYATPLSKYDSDSNFSDLDDLSVAETDYDGDGVSDFWEIALGTRLDDASDFPDLNFSDPAAFTGVNISDLKANIDSIKSNPQYSALLDVENYLEFNGTVPSSP